MDIFQALRVERRITIVLITHEQQVVPNTVRGSWLSRMAGSFPIDPTITQRMARGELAEIPVSEEVHEALSMIVAYDPASLIALRALSRNKLQTALTMIGITIGVATVLTMIALGSGAETAIEDQVRAAGMNMIVVTAGQL